jgi:hypothetical protein
MDEWHGLGMVDGGDHRNNDFPHYTSHLDGGPMLNHPPHTTRTDRNFPEFLAPDFHISPARNFSKVP